MVGGLVDEFKLSGWLVVCLTTTNEDVDSTFFVVFGGKVRFHNALVLRDSSHSSVYLTTDKS